MAYPTRPMTPEEVLAVLRRPPWAECVTGPRKQLATADMPLNKWLGIGIWPIATRFDIREMLGDVLDALNEALGTKFDEDRFIQAMSPLKAKTLGDLCQFIALEAVVADIAPASPQRAFEVLCSMLADEGADAGNLSPQSPLEPLVRRCPRVFDRELLKVAPTAMPQLDRIYPPRARRTIEVVLPASAAGGLLAMLGSFAAFAITGNLAFLWVFAFGFALGVLGVLGAVVGDTWLKRSPKTVYRLGGCRTLGDLCAVLCGAGRGEGGCSPASDDPQWA
jgi:hypothetical protein